jgi:hypothetical protein
LRLLVTGGRNYNSPLIPIYLDALHAVHPIALLIHGDAPGADTAASLWAKSRNVPQAPYPAQWGLFGRSAGPKRNQIMIDHGKPTAYHAFPGGNGTADMVRRCKKASIPEV